MTFAHPEILWLLAVIAPVLALLFLRTALIRRRLLARFAGGRLLEQLLASYSASRQWSKYLFLLAAFIFSVLALARPQWGEDLRREQARGIDVLFALDASRSMLAPDVAPSRLQRAKLALLELLREMRGDRVGLIAFSGNAFLQCPLTLDYDAFRQSLDVVEPGLIAAGGSDLAAAIEEAIEAFEEDSNEKFLVLISDGEDLAEGAEAAARSAHEAGVRIFAVGVGTEAGARIPLGINRFGVPVFVQDADGRVVISRLDETILDRAARQTDGFYTPLGPTGEGLQRVYLQGMAGAQRQEREASLEPVPIERFQIFLSIALVCLMLEMLLSNRRKTPAPSRVKTPLGMAAVLVLPLLGLPTNTEASAPPDPFVHYQLGNYAEAAEGYLSRVEQLRGEDRGDEVSPRDLFNLGTALYKAGDYAAAERALRDALSGADLGLQQRTFFNLGRNAFEQARTRSPEEAELAEGDLRRSLEHFESAVELEPKDAEARYNRDRLKEVIEELERRQEQQQQQQSQEGQSGEDQQRQEGDGSQQDEQQQQQDSQNQQQQQENGEPERRERPEAEEDGRRPLEERALDEDQEGEQPQPRGQQEEEEEEDPSESGEDLRIGQMTREEARQMLEALRQRERQLPLAETPEEAARARRNSNNRDW